MPQKLKYRDENISLIRTSVENLIKTNPEYGYSVKVSGFMVVPRTREISLFDTFSDHVNENTDVVVFTNYLGKGNTGDTITVYVSDEAYNEECNKNAGMNGTHGGAKGFNEQSELRKQIHNELQNDILKAENERLKDEVAQAKKVMREVEVFVAQVRQQSTQVKDKGLLEIIGNFATALAVSNPELLKEVPALDALISLIPKAEQKQIPQETPINGSPEVTIKAKQPELDAQTTNDLSLLKKLRRHFSEIEFDACTVMLGRLGVNKEFIPHLIYFLDEQIERKEEWIANQKRNGKDQEKNPSSEAQVKKENHEPQIGKDYPDYEDEIKIFHP
jgi:hypothetical protein